MTVYLPQLAGGLGMQFALGCPDVFTVMEDEPRGTHFVLDEPEFFAPYRARGLFLPGAGGVTSTALTMEGARSAIANKRTNIQGVALDHPYHGDAPKHSLFNDLNNYMRWLEMTANYLTHDGLPLVIFGRSTGANVALEFAARYPKKAFVCAMSAYLPDWAGYSLAKVRQRIIDAGGDPDTDPAFQWVSQLDPQFTWHHARFDDHTRAILGNRDPDYPWSQRQVLEHNIPHPETTNPFYVCQWLEFVERAGLQSRVFEGGGHNLLDPHNQSVSQAASQHVLEFLDEHLPQAGKSWYVGSPLRVRDPVSVVKGERAFSSAASDGVLLDLLRGKIRQQEGILARRPQTTTLHHSLANYCLAAELLEMPNEEITNAEIRRLLEGRPREPQPSETATDARAREHGVAAMIDAIDSAADLWLGRPVQNATMEQSTIQVLGAIPLTTVLPQTRSVRTFAQALSIALVMDDEVPVTIQADVYDFENQPVTVEAQVNAGHVASLEMKAEPKVIQRLMEHLEHNQGLLVSAYGEVSHDISIESKSSGQSITIETTENASADFVQMLLLMLFFPIYPHPVLMHYLARANLYPGHSSYSRDPDPAALLAYQERYANLSGFYASGKPGKKNHDRQKPLEEIRVIQ